MLSAQIIHRFPLLFALQMLVVCWGCCLACAESGVDEPEVDVIRYHRPSSEKDTRYNYHIALLREALGRTEAEYGPAVAKPSARRMTQQRLLFMLIEGHEEVDIVPMPTGTFRETSLTPVRIPLDKGLLGWRLFVVRREDLPRYAAVRSIGDLQKFTMGQGAQWPDVLIYKNAGIRVETSTSYESLFTMLDHQRFDGFPRGLEEAFAEVEARREEYPDLRVEPTLVLHYPFARYFWVADSLRGERLRERVTKGLEAMIADGTFDELFWQYKGEAIRKAGLAGRRVLYIENPYLPDSLPKERPELWFDPLATP